jgi:iron(III) transport system ATP-binding protein
MTALLRLHQLTKRFAPHLPPAVAEVSFAVQPGEIFALLGPSGCGKTTILRLIAGFERADQGQIFLQDRLVEDQHLHVPPERRGIGFVFQDYALFPHLTVLQNVMFGLHRLPRSDRRERALKVLELVEMTTFRDRKPAEISGGQQQRVALARSLAPEPTLLLLDEPFSNLDTALRVSTRQEMRDLFKRTGMSAVLVTHDQEEAFSFADRIGVMSVGRLEQVGTAEDVYYRPRTAFVAQFLGQTNLFPADAKGWVAETPFGSLPLHRRAQGPSLLSLRAEHLSLESSQPGAATGQITVREFKGGYLTFRVRLAGLEYTVRTDHRCPLQVGQSVRLVPTEPAVVLETAPPLRPEVLKRV